MQGERADRQAREQDDPEPSFQGRQISQWPDDRRHHRQEEEKPDHALLDQDLEKGLVRGHLQGELGPDRRPERSRPQADEWMLPCHVKSRQPDVHTAAKEPRLDVGAGAANTIE